MPSLNDKEYKCDLCGGVFDFIRDETWSEEKANQEYEALFSGCSYNNREVICDDCWKLVRPENAKSS